MRLCESSQHGQRPSLSYWDICARTFARCGRRQALELHAGMPVCMLSLPGFVCSVAPDSCSMDTFWCFAGLHGLVVHRWRSRLVHGHALYRVDLLNPFPYSRGVEAVYFFRMHLKVFREPEHNSSALTRETPASLFLWTARDGLGGDQQAAFERAGDQHAL